MTMALPIAPLVIRRDADPAAVDAFVLAHPAGTPFHRPRWIAAVEAGTGQRAHMIVAERGGQVVGLLPLNAVGSPLFGRALVSSGFAVGGGILSDDTAAVAALAQAGWALAGELRCPSMELRGGETPAGAAWQRKTGSYAGFVRALEQDDDARLKAIPRKQRAEVRKALDAGMTVTIGRDARDRTAHYRVYSQSVRNLGTPVFPRRLFTAMLDAFGDDADILTVWHGDAPVASVLSFYHKGTVLPYWGGGTLAARKLRANELMYFALMRHACGRGCTAFDFGRSKPDTGAYAYKKNWGFEPRPLAYAIRTADGSVPREVNPLNPRYRAKIAAWKKLPLWMANILGPPIARGLG